MYVREALIAACRRAELQVQLLAAAAPGGDRRNPRIVADWRLPARPTRRSLLLPSPDIYIM